MSAIYCIHIVGGQLNEELRKALFDGAEAILKDKKKGPAKVKGEGFEGRVRTDWKVGRLSAVFGTIFKVELDTEVGPIKGEYIVHSPYDEALGKRPAKIGLN
jgi:hypothetical protein